MIGDDEILRKSLTAMKAVTAGALLIAGVACSSDEEGPDPSWEVGEDAGPQQDGGDDDTGIDTGPDAIIAVDTGPSCNDQESTGVCPEGCSINDDVDCCNQDGDEWCWSEWEEGFGCTTICMGPYVPPRMPV